MLHSLTWASAATLLLLVMPLHLLAQPKRAVVLFHGQSDGSYFSYRIPALLGFKPKNADTDIVLAFAEARKNCGRDAGDIDTVVRRSDDGGRTWGDTRIVVGRRTGGKPDYGTWGNPTVAYDRVTEKVWLLLNYQPPGKAQFPCHGVCDPELAKKCEKEGLEKGIEYGDRRIFALSSDDNGQSWSQPRDITDQVKRPKGKWDAVGPGNGIQLRGKCGKGALVFPANGRNIWSTDHGNTWRRGPLLPKGTSESTLVELKDGTLLRNDRPVDKALVAGSRRPVSRSTDCGKTWTEWLLESSHPTTRVQASQISIFTKSKQWLVFSNPASTEKRQYLTIRVSRDGGNTWPHSRRIDSGKSGYSSLTTLSPRAVGVLYEQGRNKPTDHGRIVFRRMSLKWLTK